MADDKRKDYTPEEVERLIHEAEREWDYSTSDTQEVERRDQAQRLIGSWGTKPVPTWSLEVKEPTIGTVVIGEERTRFSEGVKVDDDICLFYEGEINSIIGDSESFKTWLACWTALEVLRSGGTVAYFDFEASPVGGRMKAFGASNELLEAMHYARPIDPLPAERDLRRRVLEIAAEGMDLVILDGMTEALALEGRDVNSNSDAAWYENEIMKPLVAGGSTLVYIHHAPHEGGRALGAQHWKALMTGSSILTETPNEGRVALSVLKDRNNGLAEKVHTRRRFATMALREAPAGHLEFHSEFIARTNSGSFIPTECIDKITELVGRSDGLTLTTIRQHIGFKKETVAKAVRMATKRGLIRLDETGRWPTYWPAEG